jgi:hypothetical protein
VSQQTADPGEKKRYDTPKDFEATGGSCDADLKASTKDCSVLSPKLQDSLRLFSAKLHRGNSYFRVTSTGRTPFEQNRLHLARIITWEKEGKLRDFWKRNPKKADEIYKNAYEQLYQILLQDRGNVVEDVNVETEARRLQDKVFDGNPVAAGYKPCPCGCGMGRTKHLYRVEGDTDERNKDVPFRGAVTAVDGNIIPLDGKKPRGCKCNIDAKKKGLTVKTKNYPKAGGDDFQVVKKLSDQSGLVWGGIWDRVDPIHWQLK